MTIKEATQKWANSFDAIPYGILDKLLKNDCEELMEVTPPACGDLVYVIGDYNKEGVISHRKKGRHK